MRIPINFSRSDIFPTSNKNNNKVWNDNKFPNGEKGKYAINKHMEE